jgi:hypothetical protein
MDEYACEPLNTVLNNCDIQVPVYLDQNVFSRLQEDDVARQDTLDLLRLINSKGAIFAYSMIHVAECRDSEKPEIFVAAIEAISAYFLEESSVTDTKITLSPNRAGELILREPDILDEAGWIMEYLLKPIHFSTGWLGETETQELQDELISGVVSFWNWFEKEIPYGKTFSDAGKSEMIKMVNTIPLQRLADEGRDSNQRFRKNLPQNYAQLDAVKSEEVVEYLFSQLPENEQPHIKNTYPPRFWSKVEIRKEGDLASLAFLLFLMGLVRDPRMRKKERKRREQHFRGQFRDCRHIEAAARCSIFITFDKGAARLAKAVYAYAGVKTEVLLLSVLKS